MCHFAYTVFGVSHCQFTVYGNAGFTMDAVREAIGIPSKIWAADHALFGQGIENAPLIQAWIRDPDNPEMLGMFNGMTLEAFKEYKLSSGATQITAKGKKKRQHEVEGTRVGAEATATKKRRTSERTRSQSKS